MLLFFKLFNQKRNCRKGKHEETGSRTSGKSTVEYLCKKSEGSVAFLNLEGHTTGKAVLIRKGILRVRYIVSGRATHSSKCFDGANAIAEAAHKILELEKLKDDDLDTFLNNISKYWIKNIEN